MKLFIALLVMILFITACYNQPTDTDVSEGKISFITDKEFYNAIDTVNFTVVNNSDSLLIIGLRCGGMLEMFYQIKEDSSWSENKFFDYMTLRCLTVIDTIKSKEKFSQSIPASDFKSSGTFRLVLNEDIISNAFIIN